MRWHLKLRRMGHVAGCRGVSSLDAIERTGDSLRAPHQNASQSAGVRTASSEARGAPARPRTSRQASSCPGFRSHNLASAPPRVRTMIGFAHFADRGRLNDMTGTVWGIPSVPPRAFSGEARWRRCAREARSRLGRDQLQFVPNARGNLGQIRRQRHVGPFRPRRLTPSLVAHRGLDARNGSLCIEHQFV